MNKLSLILIFFMGVLFLKCSDPSNQQNPEEILGFSLLEELPGYWVGVNDTPFGTFDWFAFDFRPISSSHVHSIYEGSTNQSIINSFFIADYNGEKKIMARNGGWLGPQYRATYFVLDKAEINSSRKYYRMVDAIGGVKRSYMELTFENGLLDFKAFKDDGGTLDDPVVHMEFKGENLNPEYSQNSISLFNYPQSISEVNFSNGFADLVDSDSALYLEEALDPFPRSEHTHLSTLLTNFQRVGAATDKDLLYYISRSILVDQDGSVNLENIDNTVLRTMSIKANEAFYTADYLHPDQYYLTAFVDFDGNFYPSQNDLSSESILVEVGSSSVITFPELKIEIIIE